MVMSASLFHTLSLSLFGSINLCDGVHWHIECSNAMTNICRIFSRMDCSAIAIVFNSLYYQHTIPHPYIYIYTKTLHCDYKQLCCASTRRPNSRKKHAPGTHNAPKTLCIMQLFRMFQNIAFVYYVSEARDIFNHSIGNYECCHSAMAEQWHRTQIKQNAKKSRIRNNVRLQMKCIIINSLKRVTRIHSLSHSLSLSIGTRVFK